MEKITENAIKAVIAIIIGLDAIVSFKEFLAGILLIAVGLVIIGINADLRQLFLSFITWVWEKISGKETQKMESSPGGVQQQSGRDSFAAGRDLILNGRPEEKNAKLELYFDEKETYHNVPIVDISPVRNGLFLHVMVKNTSTALAKNCYGELVEVKELKDGNYARAGAFVAPVILKWAHEDFGKRLDIDNEVPRRLDICNTVNGVNQFRFATEGGPRGIQTQFPKGRYKIKVRVKGDNTDFSNGAFVIEFDSNWENIKMNPA